MCLILSDGYILFFCFFHDFFTCILHAHRHLTSTLSCGNDFHSPIHVTERKSSSLYFRFTMWYFHVMVCCSCIGDMGGEKKHPKLQQKTQTPQQQQINSSLSKNNMEGSWSTHKFGGINSIRVISLHPSLWSWGTRRMTKGRMWWSSRLWTIDKDAPLRHRVSYPCSKVRVWILHCVFIG